MSNTTTEESSSVVDSLADQDHDLAALAEWAAEHSGVDFLDAPGPNVALYGRHDSLRIDVIDTQQYQPAPRRTKATPAFTTLASLAAYVRQFDGAQRSVYVSETIQAVINDDRDASPGWRDHRATYQLVQHPLFVAFRESTNKGLGQRKFAELVEDLEVCWRSPNAASMLDIAQNINANGERKLTQSLSLPDGSMNITYVADDSVMAGKAGNVHVPNLLKLRIPVFDGTDLTHDVAARLRTAKTNGGIEFLLRPNETVEQMVAKALEAVGATLADLLGPAIPVFFGKP